MVGTFGVFLADVNNILDVAVRQWGSLLVSYQSKTLVGIIMATIIQYDKSIYSEVFSALFWLVVLDILTKWLSISSQFLVAHGIAQEKITIWVKFEGIGLAFMAGKINTSNMMGGFLSKVVQFSVLLILGYQADIMINNTHLVLPFSVLDTMIGYICYSEALSIIENMRDSGVPHMDKLSELLSTNIFNKIKK